jgi:ATP-dependent Lhr-like helicase
VGEQIPVPFEIALEVGEIKGRVEQGIIEGKNLDEIVCELSLDYPINCETLKRAVSELFQHKKEGYDLPTNKKIVIEDWDDKVVIHANFGTLVNRTLASIVGHVISEDTGYPVGVQQDTYMIITQTVGEVNSSYVSQILKTLADREMDQILQKSITKTGLFKKRLINVAR